MAFNQVLVIAGVMAMLAACGSTETAASSAASTTPTAAAIDPRQAPAASAAEALPDGTYTVGQSMTLGKYVAKPSGSCYWAKFDATGATVDNDFTQGTRVEVTIESKDFSFHSEGCGGWVRDTSAEDAASAYPNSPEADNTPCSTYTTIFTEEERSDLTGRFLTELRDRHGVKPPSSRLIKTFEDEIEDVCAGGANQVYPDGTVGIAAGVIYNGDQKAYDK